MSTTKLSRSGETVLVPPKLPAYLSETHNLKQIIGKPADEDVKVIHAVIRSLNAVAHLPAFHNPDLSMQLSQHLFGAQMAVYRANYSMSILPGDQSIYTPPALPSHIPGTLERVVGAPSDDDIKAAQRTLRSVDNLATSPQLFDTDLSMKLSQHLFNLQFARYMHDSAQGSFVSDSELETGGSSTMQQQIQEPQEIPDMNQPAQTTRNVGQNNPPTTQHGPDLEGHSEIAQLGEAMRGIKNVMNESKDILENMNRVLISVQRSQTTVGFYRDEAYIVYQNPVNQRGVLASECDLPKVRHWFNGSNLNQGLSLSDDGIARYLKFFDKGDDVLQDGEEPKLITGKEEEARRLLMRELGFPYF